MPAVKVTLETFQEERSEVRAYFRLCKFCLSFVGV